MEAFLGRSEQRRRVAERWTFLPLMLAVLAAVAAGATQHPLALLVAAALYVATQFVRRAARAPDRADEEEPLGDVRVEAAGIVAVDGDATIFARTELDAGWVEAPQRTVLRTRWGHQVRVACGVEEGVAALETLGLGAAGRATTFPVAGVLESRYDGPAGASGDAGARVLHWIMPLLVMLPALAAGRWIHDGALALEILVAVLALVSLVASAAFARVARRDHVTVGSEVIVVARAFRIDAWSLADVRAIEEEGAMTRLRIDDGSAVELRRAVGGSGLAPRLRDVKAAFDAIASDPRADVLDRGERTVEAWAAHLAKVARGPSDYRNTSLGADELVAVVGDARAPADRRVGAAFLLARRADHADHRERVRIATEACADEDTRHALELAAEGELVAAELGAVARRGQNQT